MNKVALWQQKVIQTLHDPLEKIARQGLGRHDDVAKLHFEAFTGLPLKSSNKAPDRLATGADRPNLGGSREVPLNWRTHPTLTHPLQPEAALAVQWEALPAGTGARARAEDLTGQISEGIRDIALPAGGWQSADALRRGQLKLWRSLPELAAQLGVPAPFLPADSRCPDHSVWDHTRISSAAAFVVDMKAASRPAEREPWLFMFTLGGVQEFITETRTLRDLWTASMLYGELSWAAMQAVASSYGPDAILYPDLRGNPRADQWLMEELEDEDPLPEHVRAAGATTYATLIPNTFCALLPRGGAGDLPRLEDLAAGCEAAVKARWAELAGAVERYLVPRAGAGPWQRIWRRQVDGWSPPITWSAVPWLRRMAELDGLQPVAGQSLPGQRGPALPPALQERAASLSPWVSPDAWAHYEQAREAFWFTHPDFLVQERGFDYPLVHHQAKRTLQLSKGMKVPDAQEEPGEKCSVTGREEVLHNLTTDGNVGQRRREAMAFWRNRRLDPEGAGTERLGSSAAIKRFLVKADEARFTAIYEHPRDREERGKDLPRVPFPSAATLACQGFLVELAERLPGEPALQSAVEAYVSAHDLTPGPQGKGMGETTDLRVLRRLHEATRDLPAKWQRFFRIEAQYLFPETLDILERAQDRQEDKGSIAAFKVAAARLREVAAQGEDAGRDPRRRLRDGALAPPRTQLAVLRMDGDAMGKLILGEPGCIKARWRDVIHPEAVEKVNRKAGSSQALALWPSLLGVSRHMGPALHAAISRSLADFTHRIVGWVVEVEYSGKLVYAGGDDVLALLPGGEAIPCAARIQQLFSAPWVVDTQPDGDPWLWRRRSAALSTVERLHRFRIPIVEPGTPVELVSASFEPHAGGDDTPAKLPERWTIFPMLGRGVTMSAGISIAHFKTPLSTLLRESAELLDAVAKEKMGRGHLAVSLRSRGGSKARFAAPWRLSKEADDGAATAGVDRHPPDLQAHLTRVIDAFSEGQLSGRLPYVLQEDLTIMAEETVTPRLDSEREEGDPMPPPQTHPGADPLAVEAGLLDVASLGAHEVGDDDTLGRSVGLLLRGGQRYARLSHGYLPPLQPGGGGDQPKDWALVARDIVGGLLVARGLGGGS